MSDGGSHWVYDVNLIATEDLSGNFKGTWTQTLLKVTGPVSTMEGADKYWKIGVPDQSNVTGSRSGSSVKLDFGGRLLPLKYLGDNLSGAKNYYDYGSPVGGPVKYYEELQPNLGLSYITWTYTIDLKRK